MTTVVPEIALAIRGLRVDYRTRAGVVRAVRDVDLDVTAGETIGIVGESGCGKSSLARAILQLPRPTAGSVTFRGEDLAQLSGKELRRARRPVQVVFQDPVSSLNPRRRVRDIVAEPLNIWGDTPRGERAAVVSRMMESVGLEPDSFADRFPSELSGGQCQRVAIARALVASASVIVCDEAISSLDVSLRAQVINLLEDLKAEFGFSLVFIAHDLAAVRNIADRVAVMYLGRIVEIGRADDVYRSPAHHYTHGLIEAVPTIEPDGIRSSPAVPGEPPSPISPPSGCGFRTRCPMASQKCADEIPELAPYDSNDHSVACHFPRARVGELQGRLTDEQ